MLRDCLDAKVSFSSHVSVTPDMTFTITRWLIGFPIHRISFVVFLVNSIMPLPPIDIDGSGGSKGIR